MPLPPLQFTIALALPGLFLSLLGKYIPTTVFLYTQGETINS